MSPGYLNEIEQPPSACSEPEASVLVNRKIYKLIEIELQEHRFNRRFVPVRVDGVRRDDVPLLLRNTKVYSWPNDAKCLFDYLKEAHGQTIANE